MACINNKQVGKLKDFMNNGWKFADLKFQRGYVSRKSVISDGPVYVVDRGRRKCEIFALLPCYISTNYCFRVYLTK